MDNSIGAFNFFIGYESQNVFVYFLIIPLIWCVFIDYKWIRKPVLSVLFISLVAAYLLLCGGWHVFVREFFHFGVSFCAYWKRFGYSYAEACIIWCIAWPMVMTMVLMLIPSGRKTAAIS